MRQMLLKRVGEGKIKKNTRQPSSPASERELNVVARMSRSGSCS
jgi:hypothetical protein